MLGSATTVSCYVMAKNMGHEGTLTASAVMLYNIVQCIYINVMALYFKSFALI